MAARAGFAALLVALLACTARADVTYDASSAADAPLFLNDTYLIEESHGVQSGRNLFHGFERFELELGQTAYFRPTLPALRDPSLLPIEHVIGRVSGGVPSSIRGKIQSGYAADLYLLNPAGVIFGPGASLDVNGSFVASTADVLRMGPERIEIPLGRADPFPVLAVGPPSSFGFLGVGAPAAVRVADVKLSHPLRGASLALLGDSLEIERALVSAPAADLFAAAVRSGDVAIRPDSDPGPRFDFAAVESGGSMRLSEAALSSSGIEPGGAGRWPLGPPIAASGAGDLFIRAGDLLGIDSDVFANTNGPFDGGDIDIELDAGLRFERQSYQGVGIFAFSQLPGLVIPQSGGSSGNVRIRARDVALLGGARISTGAFGAGAAGTIELDVTERVTLSGRDSSTEDADESGLFATTLAGPAGAIELRARELVMDDFGVIVGETRSGEADGAFSGGKIHVEVQSLEITGNARIDSSTRGAGHAGNIEVIASESVRISGGESAEVFSGITALAQPGSTGAPGSITVETPSLVVEDGGQIATRALGELSGDDERDARVGDVNIALGGEGRLELRSSAQISVDSTGPRDAGSIQVSGARAISLDGKSRIASSAVGESDGGNLELQASERLMVENSEISASVAGGTGGNIRIDPEFVILRNGQIVAEAGEGTGGNIEITAGLFVADSLSRVSASSRSGIDGTVVIRSPDVDLSDDLAALPEDFVDPANLLADRCAARAANASGSLTLRELDALPDWPGRPRPARYPVERSAIRDPELREIFRAARAAERRGEIALALARWQRAEERAATATLRGAARLGAAQGLARSGRLERALAALDTAEAELEAGGLATVAAALRTRIRSDADELASALQAASDGDTRARIAMDLAVLRAASGETQAALLGWTEAEALARTAGDLGLAFAARANRAALASHASDGRAELDEFWSGLERAPDDHDSDYAALHVAVAELERPKPDAGLGPRLEWITARAARRGDARAESFSRALLARWLAARAEPDRAVESARTALLLAQRARAPEAELIAGYSLGSELAALGQRAAAVQALESSWALRSRFAAIPGAHAADPADESWLDPSALLDALVDQLLRLAAETEDPAQRERVLLRARDHLDDRTALALREYFADECVASQRSVSLASLPGAVVVYPALLPDRVELIVSGPDGTRSVRVAAAPDEIVLAAHALTELSQQRTSRRYRRPASQLYDWLIRPLEADLAGGERTLVVVPRGALLRVPWAALWDSRSGGHLVERYALAIAPGLTLAEAHPVSRDVRALKAGLSRGVQGFEPLPAVTRELGEVSSFYGGPVLLDERFNAAQLEAALRAEPYGVVHIASHASFGASADDAYVVTYDGRLGARRLAELVELTRFRGRPLELLTLSACDTSVGDERSALGLAGMALRAGARSTLGTLWPVNDQAAAELIGRFYRELARPGGTRAEALRSAQLAVLASPPLDHPAYWSPFVMIGSWQ